MAEFRFARVTGASGGPEQRDLLIAYLTAAPVALPANGYGPDELAPHRRHAVPTEFRTDGVWLWPGAVAYYLRWHGIALDPAFRRHIVANGHRCPPVPDEVLRAAGRAAHEYLAEAWQREELARQRMRRARIVE